ncbi:protein of unknown function [Hyphomicrobium sp. MC1]|nr:protein of unknown function [Hyphomicrobium sp. MC1]
MREIAENLGERERAQIVLSERTNPHLKPRVRACRMCLTHKVHIARRISPKVELFADISHSIRVCT